MELVQYHSSRQLSDPILLAAFRGWNDAGEAASMAADHLRDAWGAVLLAEIDPDEFYDFQFTRPRVSLVDGKTRRIEWPTPRLWAAPIPGGGRDAVLLTAFEPNNRWRRFCEAVLEVVRTKGVRLVVTLGALLSQVPHSRPVRVSATTADPQLAAQLGLALPSYEGPTGIVGVLHDACRRAGLAAVSLWAEVPHYAREHASPKAALELVRRLGALLGFATDTAALEEAARRYEQEVAEAVSADPEVAAYVSMLERQADEEEAVQQASGESIAAEVERYLRGLGGDRPPGDG